MLPLSLNSAALSRACGSKRERMNCGMYCSTHVTTAVSSATPSPGALWARRRTYKAHGGAIDSRKSGARGRDGRGWLYFGKKRRKSKCSLLLSTNVQMQTTTLFCAFASALRHCLHMRALAPDFRHFRDFGISGEIYSVCIFKPHLCFIFQKCCIFHCKEPKTVWKLESHRVTFPTLRQTGSNFDVPTHQPTVRILYCPRKAAAAARRRSFTEKYHYVMILP